MAKPQTPKSEELKVQDTDQDLDIGYPPGEEPPLPEGYRELMGYNNDDIR